MSEYTAGSEWLAHFSIDIFDKYKIENPIFYIQNKNSNKSEIDYWISFKLDREDKWVQYKKISQNTFMLKDYFPNPSDEICNKIINHFIDGLKKFYKIKKISFEIDGTIYSEHEAYRELLAKVKMGAPNLDASNLKKNNKGMMVEVFPLFHTDISEVEPHEFGKPYFKLER